MKKHRVWKMWGITLSVVLMLALVVGCSGGNTPNTSNNAPAPTSPSNSNADNAGNGTSLIAPNGISFTWLAQDMVEAPVREDWKVFEEIKQKTGVSLDFQVVSFGGYNERKQIMIATNTVTDFMQVTNQEGREHGESGVFLNLKDYFDVAPNLKKFFEDNPEAEAVATAADGGIYTVPVLEANVESNGFNYTWNARHDLMEKYNLQPPTTTSEFYDFLKALKQNEPDTYPLIMRTPIISPTGFFTVFTRAFTGLEGMIAMDPEEHVFKFAPYEDGFKDALSFMNTLYAEGLLDPEFALLTAAQWQERLMTGKSSVTYFWKSDIGPLNDNARASGASAEFDLFAIPPFAAPGVNNYQFARPAVGNNGFAVSANVKNKDTAVQFLDYLLSDEGLNYMALGLLDETYTIEDGKAMYNPEYGNAPYTTLRRDYGVWFQTITLNNAISRDAWENAPDERMQSIKTMYDGHITPAPRNFVKTKEEIELEMSKLENLNQYLEQEITKFVMGSLAVNDENLDRLIQQAKRLGVDELLAMNNAAYQRAYGN